MENACESAQTERAIHPRSTKKPMFRPRRVTCSRIHQGWITKTITKKVTKEANQQGVSLRGKHRRTHRQSRTRQTDGTQGILPGNGFTIVKCTWFGLTSWGPVTEARPLPVHGSTPGTCHCLQYQSFLTRGGLQLVSSVVVV